MVRNKGLATLVGLALLLAACGGDDDGADVREIGDGSASASGSASGTGSGSASEPASGSSSASAPASGSGSASAPACEPVGDPSTAATTVEVTLDEWSIVAEPASVPAGAIHFAASNVGQEPHEVVVARVASVEDLPVDEHGAADESRLPEGALVGEIEKFGAGETCDGVFDLEPGSYVLFCNITDTNESGEVESHLAEGMATTFTVTS